MNHDPFDLKEPEAERQRRLMSEDGKNQLAKEEKRLQREWEKRLEMAGGENRIHTELPVYFVQSTAESTLDPYSNLGQTLRRIGDEIVEKARPRNILLLVPVEATDAYVQISTIDAYTATNAYGHQFHLAGNPSLAASLTTTLAYASPPIHAVSGRLNLHSSIAPLLQGLFPESREIKFVQVSIPVLKQGGGWDSEQYYDIGNAMLKTRRNEDDLVVIGFGELKPNKTGASFSNLLHDALSHHTHHPRLISLVSLINASTGQKPSRKVSMKLAALYATLGAAGEGEGEVLDEQESCWRFGHLPMEVNPKYLPTQS